MKKLLKDSSIQSLISLALKEDVGSGDITTRTLFGKKNLKVEAIVLVKEPLIVCGIDLAELVFKKINPKIKFKKILKDGNRAQEEDSIASISGNAGSILTAERVALNFLQHLSGVATLTYLFSQSIQDTKAKILDTRKTLPAWRKLEKYAVKTGGGVNHRFGLYDAFLIKDNHLALYGSITKAIELVRKQNRKKLKVEVEVKNLNEFEEALAAKPDWILLDNMTLEDMHLAVIRKGEQKLAPILEASGNVNLNNVRAVAQTGVDYISVGALTHSAKAVDISLEIAF